MSDSTSNTAIGQFTVSRDFSTTDPYFLDDQLDPIGNLPISLDSLRDGPPGTKPFYPYSTLLRYAIKGSPNQKLLLEDIYYALESRFPYFKTAPSGWKNSIRHNLTLNPCFEKMPRPLTDRGKGSYWVVNDNIDPRTGVHRVRKKKDKPKSASGSEERDLDYTQPTFVDHTQYINPQGLHQPPPGQDHYPPSAYTPFPLGTMPQHGQVPFTPSESATQHEQPPAASPFEMPPPPLHHPPGPYATDENGNPDWRSTWAGDLQQLRDLTAQQDLAQVDDEWYRSMFERLRGALSMPPPMMMPPQTSMDMPESSVPIHEQ